VGLVSEWKWSSANTVKTTNCVVERTEGIGERRRSCGGEEAILQQKSVVTVEIRDDFEGDVGIGWLPMFPLPFSNVELVVTIVPMDPAVARENVSEAFQWAEDREVGEKAVGWWVAGRPQGNVAEHRWQNLLWVKPGLGPGGVVPASFLDLTQAHTNVEGGCRFLERGRLPFRSPTSQRCLPHGKKVAGLRPIGEVCVSRKDADNRVQVLVIDTRFGTKHVLRRNSNALEEVDHGFLFDDAIQSRLRECGVSFMWAFVRDMMPDRLRGVASEDQETGPESAALGKPLIGG